MDFRKMPVWWSWFSCAPLRGQQRHARMRRRAHLALTHARLRTALPRPPCADIDFVRYGWSALMVNEYSEWDPQYIGGQSVLTIFGLKDFQPPGKYRYYTPDVKPWDNLGILAGFFLAFFLLSWATLSFKTLTKR